MVLLDRGNFEHWQAPAPNITKVLAPYKIYGLAEQLLLPLKLWRLRPDLVHFLHNVPISYRGRRVVVVHDTTMVDFDLAPAGRLKALKYRVKRWAMLLAFRATASADMVVVPSKATKERLLVLLKGRLEAARITVIYEAIDHPAPKVRALDTARPTLLYVGTLFPFKNVGAILEAMSELVRRRPDVRLRIIGSTPRFNQSLHDQVERLGLGASVELAGFVSEAEKMKAYRAATLFIFPSLSEGFGLPPLEAMGQGLPVLAAQASALPEVLAGGADYFDPHDPKDLAKRVDELLGDPKRLTELQRRGFERLGNFSWRRMAEQTLEVYNRVRSS